VTAASKDAAIDRPDWTAESAGTPLVGTPRAEGVRRRLQLLSRLADVEGQSRGVVPIRARELPSRVDKAGIDARRPPMLEGASAVAMPPAQGAGQSAVQLTAEGAAKGAASSAADGGTARARASSLLSSKALQIARLLVASDAELSSDVAVALLSTGRPSSVENERAAARLVWSKLVRIATEFKTSAAEDSALLTALSSARAGEGKVHADRLVLALQLRLGHKALVESALCSYARHHCAVRAM
jgi:hypothetical protein